jgi:hypothetical protein
MKQSSAAVDIMQLPQGEVLDKVCPAGQLLVEEGRVFPVNREVRDKSTHSGYLELGLDDCFIVDILAWYGVWND